MSVSLYISTVAVMTVAIMMQHDTVVMARRSHRKCLPITNEMCAELGYSESSFPNTLGHNTPEHAGLEIHQYIPLVQFKCSEFFRDFVCSMYFPQCDGSDVITPPCRHLCEGARNGCENLMKKFGFEWPDSFKCDAFPDDNAQTVCFRGKQAVTTPRYTTPVPTRRHRKCLLITTPVCAELSYNESSYPNTLGQNFPEDAGLEIHQFYPLIKVQCSGFLKEFLCSVYFPPCDGSDRLIPPCRQLCEVARNDCESLMNKFGFQWPFSLKCDNFPVDNSQGTCLRGKSSVITPRYTPSTQGSLSEKVTPAPTRVPRRKRISFRKFITMFRKSLGQVNKDLSSLYSLLAEG